MLKPPALTANAVVGVVAPASPVQEDYLERGLAELARLGFRPRLGLSLRKRGRYTAGTAAERVEDLTALWEDPEIEAIFSARGGYGTLELLEHLDPERFRRAPKVLLGSSDVTALLCWSLSYLGMVAFHGPMVAQQLARGITAYDATNLRAVLSGTAGGLRIGGPEARVLHGGSAEGILWGGCLSLLVALVGTPYFPALRNTILFLEDASVKPYQIDRMLCQLRLAGLLEDVRGIVFGEMPDCQQHPDQGYELPELLAEITAPLGVPVLFGIASGHTRSAGLTIPFGVRACIGEGMLELLEGGVR